MDDYNRYQQSKGRYDSTPARNASAPQYGYDQKSQMPPPRGASVRGGPDSYASSNSSYRSPSPNPPSYRSESDDRRALFGDRGAPSGNAGPRGNYGNDQYGGRRDDRYAGERGGGSGGRYETQQDYNEGGRYRAGEDYDAYGDTRYAQQQEDEEVDGIKQQIKFTKQDTLASTRNALNRMRETEELGGQTLNRLAQQSEQLGNVDRNLDLAKAHADRAVEKTGELKQLQRSMFMPVFKNPFNKKSREIRELEAVRQDHREHAATRDEIRKFEYESQQRIANLERQRQYKKNDRGDESTKNHERYQFEADAEDDAIENEIDSNLDELSAMTGRLKGLAMTMNDELTAQNKVLKKTVDKVDPLGERITTTTHRINKIK